MKSSTNKALLVASILQANLSTKAERVLSRGFALEVDRNTNMLSDYIAVHRKSLGMWPVRSSTGIVDIRELFNSVGKYKYHNRKVWYVNRLW